MDTYSNEAVNEFVEGIIFCTWLKIIIYIIKVFVMREIIVDEVHRVINLFIEWSTYVFLARLTITCVFK